MTAIGVALPAEADVAQNLIERTSWRSSIFMRLQAWFATRSARVSSDLRSARLFIIQNLRFLGHTGVYIAF